MMQIPPQMNGYLYVSYIFEITTNIAEKEQT